MKTIKNRLAFIVAFFMLFVGCQKNDSKSEAVLQQVEQEEVAFLKSVSNETTSMFSSVIGDLNNEFRFLSPSKLSNFDARSFTENAILSYSKTSIILSPHVEEIEQMFEQAQLKKVAGGKFTARTSQNYSSESLQEQEQDFVLEIQNAFSLMPDIDAFKSEIASINVRISNEVSEESTRLKLLTVSATSEATAVYWAENQDQILADIRNAAEHWTGEHSAMMRTKHSSSTMYGPASIDPPKDGNGGSSCCFQGEFQWSWSDFGRVTVGSAVAGGVLGAIFGGSVSFGALTLPGYAAGALSGGIGGAIIYTVDQIWEWAESEPSEQQENEDGGTSQ